MPGSFSASGIAQQIVSTFVEATNSIIQGIASGKNENRRLKALPPKGGQDFESIPSWQHQIEDEQIESLRVDEKKAFFARVCESYFVVPRLQALLQRSSHF